jgi:hypothetical protein
LNYASPAQLIVTVVVWQPEQHVVDHIVNLTINASPAKLTVTVVVESRTTVVWRLEQHRLIGHHIRPMRRERLFLRVNGRVSVSLARLCFTTALRQCCITNDREFSFVVKSVRIKGLLEYELTYGMLLMLLKSIEHEMTFTRWRRHNTK